MGCGCNKNKGKTPASVAASKQASGQTAGAATKSSMKDAVDGMKGKTQQFALVLRDGRTLRFGSRLEADAENVRQGYTGQVKPT